MSDKERIKALEADNAALREALGGLLTHSGIADVDAWDKDPEDHAVERTARTALDAPSPGEKLLAVVRAARDLHAHIKRIHYQDSVGLRLDDVVPQFERMTQALDALEENGDAWPDQ